ncbi:hypothetical protein EAF00_008430 [Botryotinia globosa]|nr:hypothetical protein EAF00_008430 [Botryotinia globosa]
MSFRTFEEPVAAYENALPQQRYRDPGSNLAQPPTCGDQVSHFLEDNLANANHLSYNNFYDNNLDNLIIFPHGEHPIYDLEFDYDLFACQDGYSRFNDRLGTREIVQREAGNVVFPHQTTSVLESMVQCPSQRLADCPASRNSSISAGVEFTSNNFRSKLFDRVCETISKFEDKPLNRLNQKSHTGYLSRFWLQRGDYENGKLGWRIYTGDCSRRRYIPWKDMKSTKIVESVHKIYSEVGYDQPIPQNISSRRHNTRTASSDSTPRAKRDASVISLSSKHPSDYEGSTSVAYSFSKRLKVSSDEYICYYDNYNASVGLKGIGPRNKIHNSYEFFACIVPDCPKTFPRKDTMNSHLKTKSHEGHLKGISEAKMSISERIKENTFIITDRTYDHRTFCDTKLPRGSRKKCWESHVHILTHFRTSTSLVFHHLCPDKDNTCIQPENRKRVPDSDFDNYDGEVRSEIDEHNFDFSDNGDSTEPQERPDTNLYIEESSAQDYRGGNESFSGRSYPGNRGLSEYISPYPNKQPSRLRPMLDALNNPSDTASDVAMSRFCAEDPDSEHHNNYTVRDPSHEPLRYGMLKSSVNSYARIVEQRDDNTTIQSSIT